MSDKMDITHEYLVSILDYNPETGIFVWRERPVEHFKTKHHGKTWNTRFSNKITGTSKDKGGYCLLGIDQKTYKAHRLAWFYVHKQWPKNQIDHVDGIRHNNKINNLREATRFENNRNKKVLIKMGTKELLLLNAEINGNHLLEQI